MPVAPLWASKGLLQACMQGNPDHLACVMQDMLSAVATSPDAYILHHPCAAPLLAAAERTIMDHVDFLDGIGARTPG